MIGATPEDSIGSIDEPELIRHLLHDWHWGAPVLQAFGLAPGATNKPELMLWDFGRTDDLDLLSASSARPQEATAVQFKVAKVSADTYFTLMPNKLHELRKLYRQTNPLIQLGFHRVFACLVVLIDARRTPADQTLFGGLTEALLPELHSRISPEGLHPQAGFVRVDLVQESGSAPLTSGEIACQTLRYPTAQPQTQRVTQWVARQLSAA